jgi:hypothetical protein
MFIEQAAIRDNKFWKYLVGTLCIVVATTVSQLPLVIAIAYKSFADDQPFPVDSIEMMTYLDSNLTLFLLLLSFVGGLLTVFILAKNFHKQSITSLTTARPRIDWSRFWFAFILWGSLTVVTIAIDYSIAPEDYVFNFKPIPFLILALIAVVMIPLQTSAEEYIFRAYLMQGIGLAAQNRWVPLIVTSAIFGLMHISNPEVDKIGYVMLVYYIGTGLFLGTITLMDDGIELPLGFHAANNLVGAILVTSEWTAFQTESLLKDIADPQAGVDIILPVLIIFPLQLYIFGRKYKWTNWKEKLTGKINVYGNDVPAPANGEPHI